ncbi:MAG TPA: DUF2157 domain-containing protein [Fluviicoccus sp.]|nr:DUF2157 domain-containing protein [Fluviicoccus sp.]
MSADKSRIRRWAESGRLRPEQVPAALAVAAVEPSPQQWRRFLERFFLFNGGALVLAAILFFFAANWDALGRFARFGLIESALLLSLAAAWRWFDRPAGKAALTAAGVLTGVWLAYFGQTYQTGADPWQLFAVWAVLILPWAGLGRSPSLWLLWVLLVNITVPLYFSDHGIVAGLFGSHDLPVWLLFAFNTLAQALWETAARRVDWLPGRSGPRLLALGAGLAVSLQTLEGVLNPDAGLWPVLALYLLWSAATLILYRGRLADLFMLAGVVFSALVISTSALGKFVFHGDGLFAFFLMSIWLIVCSGAAVRWLKAVYRELPHE